MSEAGVDIGSLVVVAILFFWVLAFVMRKGTK